MRLRDLTDAGRMPPDTIQDTYQNSTPITPYINISLNDLLKLWLNLKPGKAAGPDKLKPLLLIELRAEIAPMIKIIWKNIGTRKASSRLGEGKCHASFQKTIASSKLSTYFAHLHSLPDSWTYSCIKHSQASWQAGLMYDLQPPSWVPWEEVMWDPVCHAHRVPCKECQSR